MKNKFKKLIILSFVFAIICSNAIFASNLNPGEVAFSKKAQWVDKENGIAKITLAVESAPVSRPVDVVLVVDRSGSMTFGSSSRYSPCMNTEHFDDEGNHIDKVGREGCVDRYDVAESAVSNFLTNLYNTKGAEESRVALITFSAGSNAATIDQEFTTDSSKITSAMSGKKISGNTNYDAALEKVNLLINSRTTETDRPTYIIFLTDGNPEPDNKNGETQAKILKDNGTIIYGVAIGTNVTSDALKNLSSGTNYCYSGITTAQGLNDIYIEILSRLKNAGTDSKVTDVISNDFEYYEDDTYKPTATPSMYPKDSEDGKTIEWIKKEITESEKIYEFYIKLKDGEEYDFGTWDTNKNAELSYKDINEEEKTIIADIPQLSRYKYVVEHYLENEDGIYSNNPEVTEKFLAEKGEKVVGEPKSFEDYEFNLDIEETVVEGIISEDNKVVLKLYYQKPRSKIVVKYVDENGTQIADSIELEGRIGEKANAQIKEIEGYKITNEPEITEVMYTNDTQEIIYVYSRIKGKVITEYIDTSGNKIADDYIEEGYVGDEYLTLRQNISGYVPYGSTPTNYKGSYIDGEILVTYVYETKIVDTSDINIMLYIGIFIAAIIGILLVIFGRKKLRVKNEK